MRIIAAHESKAPPVAASATGVQRDAPRWQVSGANKKKKKKKRKEKDVLDILQ